MGNENFLVYFQGISPKDINSISDEFYKQRTIYRNIYSTVLLNQRSIVADDNSKQKNKFQKDFLFKNGHIALLCKLKELYRLDDIDVEKEILSIIKKNNLGRLHKLYGIFDYKIMVRDQEDILNKISYFISQTQNIFIDTQLEYQSEIVNV